MSRHHHPRRPRHWWMRQHDRYRIPWCWDCRLGRQAVRVGDFYAHDPPRWYIDELFARGEPATIVTERPDDD